MSNRDVVPFDRIEKRIFLIRGKKVMFDRDLAALYGVEAKVLNQAVKRNLKRFPPDFMSKLTDKEMEFWKYQIWALHSKPNSRSQIVTLKRGNNIKYAPYIFTEQGIAMLSSVLNSDRAIQVNIQIMRTFTKLREMLASNKELREKIEKLERKYDGKFNEIFQVIKQLITIEIKPKSKIGFRT